MTEPCIKILDACAHVSLLTRLQELNAEVPFETTGSLFGRLFGSEQKNPHVQEQTLELDKSKFIHLMTVEEMAEIEDTKTKISACLKELKSMEAEAFVFSETRTPVTLSDCGPLSSSARTSILELEEGEREQQRRESNQRRRAHRVSRSDHLVAVGVRTSI